MLFALFCGLGLGFSNPGKMQASTVHFNKAPKVLKGPWATKDRKPKTHNDKRIHYWVTYLYVTNRDFHLEDFALDKHKENLFNSGPYGSFAGERHKLAFRKISSRHYVITGDYQILSDQYKSGYRVRLSKSRKSMKVYRYTKVKRPGYVFGHRYYVGKFYRNK